MLSERKLNYCTYSCFYFPLTFQNFKWANQKYSLTLAIILNPNCEINAIHLIYPENERCMF